MLQPNSGSTCQRVSGEHPGEEIQISYSNEGHLHTVSMKQRYLKI